MLKLHNVTEEDAGEYICKVSNYIGEANQSAWLVVLQDKGKNVCSRKLDVEAGKNGALGLFRQLVG